MDIANQLFSLTLGIEPNKQTLQKVAGALNNAVLSLSDQSKALEHYADSVEPAKVSSNAPVFNQQQIKYIEAAPTEQAKQARKAKVLRDPVVWQITEKQMKALIWKRKQLLQAQKAELERRKAARAKRPPPPKLGKSKAALAQQEKEKAEREKRIAMQKSEAIQADLPPPPSKNQSSNKPPLNRGVSQAKPPLNRGVSQAAVNAAQKQQQKQQQPQQRPQPQRQQSQAPPTTPQKSPNGRKPPKLGPKQPTTPKGNGRLPAN